MDFKPVRRVVIGHDADGRAIAQFDSVAVPKQRSAGSNAAVTLWVTEEFPIDMSGTEDRGETPVAVPPPAHGTVFRIVDFPPTPKDGHAIPTDHHKILIGMGLDLATQGYARHRNTHRTRSIDYAIVLDGEIDMLMDDTQIHLKAGDTLVQQATNHAWVNNGERPCRIAFVLIDGLMPPAWNKAWKPD
jgi:quercetin dioxygenase-like cupin family protein